MRCTCRSIHALVVEILSGDTLSIAFRYCLLKSSIHTLANNIDSTWNHSGKGNNVPFTLEHSGTLDLADLSDQ